MSKVKFHKVTLTVSNFEDTSDADVKTLLEQNRYLGVHVESLQTVEISDWTDEHPLNQKSTQEAEMARLFPDRTEEAYKNLYEHKTKRYQADADRSLALMAATIEAFEATLKNAVKTERDRCVALTKSYIGLESLVKDLENSEGT